ncbi:MAG TPA: PQQ-binding-like beta-propeller repeat protein [Vicinamibacteria bacterium]|nr:PQQ-binding-like beta-propeller repeat protein [Vicinamibacteria bacterium]
MSHLRYSLPAMPIRSLARPLLLSMLTLGWDWPQFRGSNAAGVSEDTELPIHFGPETNVVWRTELPSGPSSPSIAGERIFLTGVDNERLFTFALDRRTGRILWRREAPRPRRQVLQPNNSPASPTPATDGRNVYVFFADFGLLAYGPDGEELWSLPLGPFNNPFGHGSSPILAGDLVLQVCDQDAGAFVIAVHKATGEVRWKTERPHAQRGYATPVLYRPGEEDALQVLVAGSYQLNAYDVASGTPVWWLTGLPWQIKPTPVLADHAVYFVTSSGESDPGEQEIVPSFPEALAQLDENQDGKLAKGELVDSRAIGRFDEYLDLDDTGFLEERDWAQFRFRRQGMNSLWAYRLGGEGDMTEGNFLWKNPSALPNVPSPLYYRGVLYTLKEGGILTSFDPDTGEILERGRLRGALGAYFSSPVAADGKIYAVSEEGNVAVVRAGGDWELLAVNRLDDGTKATPAIADGKLYIRTYSALYSFSQNR